MSFLRPTRTIAGLVSAAFLFSGCGSEPTLPSIALDELVGHWEATALVLTSVEDPSQSFDAIEEGATFFINIQPSGGFTSHLAFLGFSADELGEVEVAGDELILHVQVASTGPRVDTAIFELDEDQLTLSGPTVFDFDGNGLPEDATLDATLQRDPGG